MARAFTQAQKFGAQFSLSTEVKQLDCTSERSGPDPALILELADGRLVRGARGGGCDGCSLSPTGDPQLEEVRRPRRFVLGLAGRGSAVPRRTDGVAGRRKLGGAGGGIRQPRAKGVDAGARAEPGEDDVALSHRSNSGLFECRRCSATPRSWGCREPRITVCRACVAQPPYWKGGGARDPSSLPLHRCRPRPAGSRDAVFRWTRRGFIRTGAEVGSMIANVADGDRSRGIFAVGDVHSGSVKRVGAAIGEGAAVVAQLHTFLARREAYVSLAR